MSYHHESREPRCDRCTCDGCVITIEAMSVGFIVFPKRSTIEAMVQWVLHLFHKWIAASQGASHMSNPLDEKLARAPPKVVAM